MTTYYIDPNSNNSNHDGLSPEKPLSDYTSLKLAGGDTVLFKRACMIREMLHTQCGTDGAPITYGAYGEGEKPTFMGSVPIGDSGMWVEERPSVWKYSGKFSSEVCNLVFNNGESCGNLRWSVDDLRTQGEWFFTLIGNGDKNMDAQTFQTGILYLYSTQNPALAYASIECVLWGKRKLAGGKSNIIFENLCFRNSGVHGYAESDVKNIIIRRCDFFFIGGAVWHRERRIRFGNAVEFWDGASDVVVEQCRFDNIYDSGVTHQGGLTVHIPHHLYFRDNLFSNYGMAAYECREPSYEVYFENNTCLYAGGGFSLQGEPLPRQSEIYPQPMGHHVFIWKVDPGTQPGAVYMRKNVFYEAPYGAAIYSIIDPDDERKMVFDDNIYWQTTGELLNRVNACNYLPAHFAQYQTECSQDTKSRFEKPVFQNESDGDYRLANPTVGYRHKL